MPPDDVDGFYLALAENPDDSLTLHALADWYEERGEAENAACLRWCARRGLRPFRYSKDAGLTVSSAAFVEGRYWWAIDTPSYGSDWGHPRSCRLPPKLWKRLKNTFPTASLVFQHYDGARAAYEALFAAWPGVSPREREKLA